jgi:hypothetical protein
MTTEMVVMETTTLADDEAAIEHGMATGVASFVEIGDALMRIKEGAKYAAEYDTFENYCKVRWGLNLRHAQQQMAAARACTIVHAHGLPAPPSEYAARPLVKLYNEAGSYDRALGDVRDPRAGERAVVEAWRQVVARADESRPITGRDVSNTISPPAAAHKPGWFELLGQVGDDLIAMRRHLDKAENAITRRPKAELRAKAAQYADWADDVAARLRSISE